MPIKDPEKRRDYNRAYARRRRAGLTRLTSQTLSSNVYMNPQHVETVLDLHDVMAQAIDMLRNDQESTPVSRARALAYCCSVDAKLIEMATISEPPQSEQSEEHESELDVEYDAAEAELIQHEPGGQLYCEWIVCAVRLEHQGGAESEAEFQAATSDLVSKASKTDCDLQTVYLDAVRMRGA